MFAKRVKHVGAGNHCDVGGDYQAQDRKGDRERIHRETDRQRPAHVEQAKQCDKREQADPPAMPEADTCP